MKPQQTPPTKVTIVINGRPYHVDQETITYEELISLALPNDPQNSEHKVTYAGPQQDDGVLMPTQSIEIRNGMRFNVTLTGRS